MEREKQVLMEISSVDDLQEWVNRHSENASQFLRKADTILCDFVSSVHAAPVRNGALAGLPMKVQVRVVHLSNAVELNGVLGTVLRWDAARARFEVKFDAI